jgi:osmoprotectant transport system permease protein
MNELIAFVAAHRAELVARLGEHLVLVLASTAIAAALGIPLGIAAARWSSLARPIVAIANFAQTIPSLALFGFLIPLPFIGGIGTRTALVALTLYAVLPILRGTITGIQGVAPSVVECATAMGLTSRQVLWRIEWPLALPSILSGLRVAMVIGVGTATIASAIGAGGLGDYIFRGLAMVDGTVILAGALPAAALALAADGILALAARAADARRRTAATTAVLSAILIVMVVAATFSMRATASRDLVVGSKNFTEQVVLGELLAQLIERETTLTVERRLNLGGTAIAHQALLSGGIDLYVEYSGTALTAIFNQPPLTNSDDVYRAIRERYAAVGITALPRLGFNNTFAILVRRADAERLGLKTIGDLAKVPQWRAGFGYEFLERPDGFKGLAAAYGLQFGNQPRVMDLNLIYRAVASKEIDVTAGDATSGLISALDLVILEDDRRYFPAYDAVPLARASTLLQHPDVADLLRRLEGRVSAAEMQRMNHAVDGDKRDPAEVARAFLDTIARFYVQPR